jgi:electron transfer flavoprotein alpha subunit
MSDNIMVFVEYRDEKPLKVGLEMLSKARELADEKGSHLYALVLTDRAKDTEMLFKYGADAVYLAEDERLKYYNPLFSAITLRVLREIEPYAFLVGATALGSMLAPEVAAHLRTGLAAHVIDLRLDEELVQVVPSFGGRIAAEIITPETRPKMSTVKPGTFRLVERPREGRIVRVDTSLPEDKRIRVKGFERIEPRGIPVEEADVVVVGGGGIESEKDWGMLRELADLLNGALGCTRPVVDKTWSDEGHMVGTSGKNIRPKVYIGIGVSGSAHHTCGMKDAGIVIAVNKDKNAPIFDIADLRVIGDYREILPALLSRLRGS